jgi:hypothetical protein
LPRHREAAKRPWQSRDAPQTTTWPPSPAPSSLALAWPPLKATRYAGALRAALTAGQPSALSISAGTKKRPVNRTKKRSNTKGCKAEMHPDFARVTESLHASFERLLNFTPLHGGKFPTEIPIRGVDLFSEFGKHLYVGRSNNIRNRYAAHTLPSSKQYSAAYAMILSRHETGRKAGCRPGADSRKGLTQNAEFFKVFERQKRRITAMDFRYVEEINTAAAEAIVLKTHFNDFDNH